MAVGADGMTVFHPNAGDEPALRGLSAEARLATLPGVDGVGESVVRPRPASAWTRIVPDGRATLELALFALPALLAPLLLFKYLAGTYHERPITLDGRYYPDGGFLFDLHVMWKAGHDIVLGHSPYPFVYPAPAAVLMVPFGALPWKVAVVAFALAVYATAVAALRLVGVRDWRCYGAALGSLPGFTAVTAGTLSWPLAFGAAAAWRYRERRWVVAASIVGVVVTKLFLWPLFIWLVATRRLRTAVTTAALGLVVVIGSWAVIGFDGLLDYPHRLGRTAGLEQTKSFSVFSLMRLLGAGSREAHVALAALTLVAVATIFLAARGEDGDRRAFACAVGAGLLLSPIVWPHYLVLGFIVLALYQPRLGAAWIVPVFLWVLPWQPNRVSSLLTAFAVILVAGTLAVRRELPARRA